MFSPNVKIRSSNHNQDLKQNIEKENKVINRVLTANIQIKTDPKSTLPSTEVDI